MKRIFTALVGIPLVLLATFYFPDWLFALFASLFAALCFEELLTIAGRRSTGRPGRWVVALGAIVTASFMGGPEWVITTLTLSLLISMSVITLGSPLEACLPRFGLAALGLVYCCVLLGFMVFLQREAIMVLFGITWTGDSVAYYAGRTAGRHPLAPAISPKKTVEGAIAGLLGSVLAGVLLGRWLLKEPAVMLAGASLVSGLAGQIGDLAESAIKRSTGVKDSSAILPGHGGILDRLDSLLFAAPVFYWFFYR